MYRWYEYDNIGAVLSLLKAIEHRPTYMVRLSDLIDLDGGGMTRKFLSNKGHEGLEAPRNRSEVPAEASRSFCIGGDDTLCTYRMTNDWPEKNCYVNEAPMKKLTSEELAKRSNTGHNAPSVVARLMGLDTLSVDTKPSAKKGKEMKESNQPPKEEQLRNVSSRQKVYDSFDSQSNNLKFNKPKPREHPQEEELQKFKKEFEAYQAARFKECSKFVELGTNTYQWLAQRHLNKEKVVLSANSMRKTVTERSVELKAHAATENPHERGNSKLQKNKNKTLASEQYKTNRARNTKSGSAQRLDFASAPTKIVILRPVSDRMRKDEESWAGSPSISEDGSSIEEFLQEVKERLNFELQEKCIRRRITAIETSYTEKRSDAKKIAQCIAKQARESVTRGVETPLPRSESMRSYRSEIQCDEIGSPEFTNSRNARRIMTGRLRNVREESSHDIHKHGPGEWRKIRYTSNKVSHGDEMKDEPDMQSRYFRRALCNDVMLDQKLFHRNLVRSLSAPVSRSSFGKLLLEDQHMLTGAHIRRKHETIEKVTTVNVKKWRKEKFNLKEKVSSFKYSFVLRGRLFRRNNHSSEESYGHKQIHVKDPLNTPTVASKFYAKQENSTEVPPSPASVCSTRNEEFWRQTDNFSPSSTSDEHPVDDSEIPHVFKEISSNLNELRRQLNQLETYDSEETMIDEQPIEEEITEINDPAEVFVRDLLVASGLYYGSCDKYLSKWDPLGRPVSNQVFEEVEESYRQNINDEEGSSTDQLQKLNHKLLCDFLNEMLPGVLEVPSTTSSFMKRTIGPTGRAPRGKKLLDCVWKIVRVYVYPPSDMSSRSLESILARDLQCTRWDGLVDEDVNALGKDVEYQIIGDLIHEMINDT
ncbi:hypothetical protein K7X08_032921 [Anisodus acutangulus]|uniref:DUF4378 domain-containing protein n=1 Tax=Anisodus acutangulus TaxID=402998 RepID=A0A9Q1M5M4_9SOLA|nr:hypothetical protein K7X08_032921 [Anisodus acutangulus]